MCYSGNIHPVQVHMFLEFILPVKSLDYLEYALVIDRIYRITCILEVRTLSLIRLVNYLVDDVTEFINQKLMIQHGTGIINTMTFDIQIILVNPHTVFITRASRKFRGYFLYTLTAY
jgi:hypothetical protein